MFGKLRDSWVVWRRKVGEKLDTQSETLEDYGETLDEYGETLDTYGEKLDTYNPIAKTEDMSTPVGVDSDGKLWTSDGGSGEPKPSLEEFNVVANTPLSIQSQIGENLAKISLTIDVELNGTKYKYDGTEWENDYIDVSWIHIDEDSGDEYLIRLTYEDDTWTITSTTSGTIKITSSDARIFQIFARYRPSSNIIEVHENFAQLATATSSGVALQLVVYGNFNSQPVNFSAPVTLIEYYSVSPNGWKRSFNCDVYIDNTFQFSVDSYGTIVGEVNVTNS